jgi:hypothetical protein
LIKGFSSLSNSWPANMGGMSTTTTTTHNNYHLPFFAGLQT